MFLIVFLFVFYLIWKGNIVIQSSFQELLKMADAVAKSRLFGIDTPEQALALMSIAQAEGYHPAQAARDYHIIKGKPTLKADAMLARFQQSGGKVSWDSYTDVRVVGTFSHPQGGAVTVDWDLDRAKKAGLLSNPTWQKFPRNMLRARVISEAIKTIYPGVSVGIYTPEEVEDFEDKKAPVLQIARQNEKQVNNKQIESNEKKDDKSNFVIKLNMTMDKYIGIYGVDKRNEQEKLFLRVIWLEIKNKNPIEKEIENEVKNGFETYFKNALKKIDVAAGELFDDAEKGQLEYQRAEKGS